LFDCKIRNRNGVIKLSSILKALKKLENQAKNKSQVRFRQQENRQQPIQRRRMSDYLRANRHYLIILAALIFATGAGIALNQKVRYNNQKAAAKTNVAPKKETRPQSPARIPDKKTAISNGIEKKSFSPKIIKEPERTKKVVKMPPGPVDTSRAVQLDVLKEASSSKQAEKKTIVAKGNEKHESYVKPEQFAGVPVKRSSETEIEIQAIAWSKDPIGRLVVINGLILREGESIDNVVIVGIGKDAVVFEKGEQKWKQMFGFK
jgi:hypothetical protein